MDGVDSVMADIQGDGYDLTVTVLGGQTVAYQPTLRQQILDVCGGTRLSLADLATLDDAIAHCFAQVAQSLMAAHGPADLIASHGQTVFHRPARTTGASTASLGYSVQLGRGELIAALTQCLTVSDFRQADIAAGGEGAPLVPPVDLALLRHPPRTRCVQNLGGIGNVALLPPRRATSQTQLPQVLGWDTGPGNSLLDLAVEHFSQGRQTYDHNGAWAAQGTPCESLAAQWLDHPYFAKLPPESTGRELFGPDFLEQ